MTNILLVGDAGVGKTSWLRRLLANGFSDTYITTIGKNTEVLTYHGRKLVIHDFGGFERFSNVTDLYYSVAHGAIVFYDERNDRLQYWIDKVAHVPYIVVQNKIDLKPVACTALHYQISCKNNVSIHDVLETLLEKIPTHERTDISMLHYVWQILTHWLRIPTLQA